MLCELNDALCCHFPNYVTIAYHMPPTRSHCLFSDLAVAARFVRLKSLYYVNKTVMLTLV